MIANPNTNMAATTSHQPSRQEGAAAKQRQLWTLYGQRVDLEAFAQDHPGGSLALRMGKGAKDCTRLYESYHILNEHHRSVLKKWGVDAPKTTSDFHNELKGMIQDYKRETGTIKATWGHLALVAVLGLFALWALVGWVQGSIIATLAWPWAYWLFGINTSHDGSHFAMSTKPLLNELWAWTAAPYLYNPYSWASQHVVSHHCNTNDPDHDVDLRHLRPYNTKTHRHIRVKGTPNTGGLRWLPLVTVQEAVMHPVLLVLKGTILGGTMNRIAGVAAWKHLISTPMYLAIVVAPFLLHTPAWATFAALYPVVVVGVLFTIITQVSHLQEECQLPEVENEGDWIKRQAMTSLDYSPTSAFWRIFTGGLNTQSLHHCMPGVSSCHYDTLYPRFAAICKKHGAAPVVSPSLWTAFNGFLTHINKVNESPARHAPNCECCQGKDVLDKAKLA